MSSAHAIYSSCSSGVILKTTPEHLTPTSPFSQGFKNFVFPKEVDPSYAYYFLRRIRSFAENLGTGTTFKEISGTKAKTLPFILPPLAEQKAIADKLDTLLAQVKIIQAHHMVC